jgi:hypothetical protein
LEILGTFRSLSTLLILAQVGIPFLGFMLFGSYGLSTWVEGRLAMKQEKAQQEQVQAGEGPPPSLPHTHHRLTIYRRIVVAFARRSAALMKTV